MTHEAVHTHTHTLKFHKNWSVFVPMGAFKCCFLFIYLIFWLHHSMKMLSGQGLNSSHSSNQPEPQQGQCQILNSPSHQGAPKCCLLNLLLSPAFFNTHTHTLPRIDFITGIIKTGRYWLGVLTQFKEIGLSIKNTFFHLPGWLTGLTSATTSWAASDKSLI